ncbi:MAG: methyltransferase type 12 [Gammaproteobacteria bacterium]|nr:MAG: methyltransferase type 12 [Pseudomonadota bacterium]PIE38496.1 MAG: methyltransferase type 12 [Gammaproteobacteria bacterium]
MNIDRLSNNLKKTLPDSNLKATVLPGCPEISLFLFDPERLQGPLDHDVAQAVVAEPAYWSFCWASGQAMASYLLQNPHLVQDKEVLDFGSGSGVVAIAAAMAGAKSVTALDIDRQALDACEANAQLNGVSLSVLSDFDSCQGKIDVVSAADVLYDRDNMHWLDTLLTRADKVLLADSRVKNLNHPHYTLHQAYRCRTWPDLNEFEEFNTVRIYQGEKTESDSVQNRW